MIGKNCRFLQGPKTSHSAVRRLIEAISAGEDTCELILNYRRDGSAFFNLLMTAPLYDNKGEVRYFLGSQIDVSPLVDDGKGLESFAQLLSHDRSVRESDFRKPRDPLDILGDLAEMLSEPEAKSVQDRMRGGSQDSGRSTPIKRRPTTRRYLSRDEANQDGASAHLWPDLSLGHSGRLPGVYRNVREILLHLNLQTLIYCSTCSFDRTHRYESRLHRLLFGYQVFCKPSCSIALEGLNQSATASLML